MVPGRPTISPGGKDRAGAHREALWVKGWCFLSTIVLGHTAALSDPKCRGHEKYSGSRRTFRLWGLCDCSSDLERGYTHDHQQALRKETLFIYAPSRLQILNEGSSETQTVILPKMSQNEVTSELNLFLLSYQNPCMCIFPATVENKYSESETFNIQKCYKNLLFIY